MRDSLRYCFLIIWSLLFLVSCTYARAEHPMIPVQASPATTTLNTESLDTEDKVSPPNGVENISFQIHILEEKWNQLGLGYEFERSQVILEKITSDSLTLLANDIDTYNWPEQSITLTLEASAKVRAILPQEKSLSMELERRGVAITLDGSFLYGGIFLEPGSAMAISYPVIYIQESGEQVVFLIRPVHSVLLNYQDFDQADKDVIALQQIHDLFSNLGKLVE